MEGGYQHTHPQHAPTASKIDYMTNSNRIVGIT